MAGKSSWDDMAEGLSEGRDDVLVKFSGWDRSADYDLGRGIWYGRRYFSGSVLAGGRECLFDGEVVKTVGSNREMVAEAEVEAEEVAVVVFERRGPTLGCCTPGRCISLRGAYGCPYTPTVTRSF